MFNILISAMLAGTGAAAQAVQAPVSGQTAAPIAKVLLDAVHDADSPPDGKTLRVLCAAKVETGPVVSFVGAADGRVLLATLTESPLVDPSREIALLRWSLEAEQQQPGPSSTMDWGYVYDHDRDGRIDHLAFLIGPMLFEPEVPPPNLPPVTGLDEVSRRVTAALFAPDSTRTGFWQLLDTDHDGAMDTLAYPAMQKSNGWIRGWAVLTDPGAAPARRTCRIMDRDGRVIEGCTAVAGSAGGIDDGHGGYEGSTASAHEHAQRPDLVWEALQQGANACRLKAGNFRP
jgi:hypothetical protein